MKKTFLLLAVVFCATIVNAQTIRAKAYKGFVDANFVVGNDGVWPHFNVLGGGAFTSHGYQLTPNIFLGGGIGIQAYNLDHFENGISLPIYANARFNMNSKRFSPFFDAKIGYSVVDYSGLFVAPSFGIRYGLVGNVGLNLSVGYTCQGFEYVGYRYYYDNSFLHNLSISLGIDF